MISGFHSVLTVPMFRLFIKLLTCVLLAFVILMQSSRADLISLAGAESAQNVAEINVTDDRLHISLEIFVNDLALFQDLVRNEDVIAGDYDIHWLENYLAKQQG